MSSERNKRPGAVVTPCKVLPPSQRIRMTNNDLGIVKEYDLFDLTAWSSDEEDDEAVVWANEVP